MSHFLDGHINMNFTANFVFFGMNDLLLSRLKYIRAVVASVLVPILTIYSHTFAHPSVFFRNTLYLSQYSPPKISINFDAVTHNIGYTYL